MAHLRVRHHGRFAHGGEAHDLFLARSAGQDAGQAPLAHDGDAVGEPQDFGKLRGNDDDGLALGGQQASEVVHRQARVVEEHPLHLRAHVLRQVVAAPALLAQPPGDVVEAVVAELVGAVEAGLLPEGLAVDESTVVTVAEQLVVTGEGRARRVVAVDGGVTVSAL